MNIVLNYGVVRLRTLPSFKTVANVIINFALWTAVVACVVFFIAAGIIIGG